MSADDPEWLKRPTVATPEEMQAFLKRFNAGIAARERRDIQLLREMGFPKAADYRERKNADDLAAYFERQNTAKDLAGAEVEVTQTVGTETAGETVLGAAAEGGLEAGGMVGAAGGFEIPVWGWIATGVAAAAGVAYGVYKHYQHKDDASSAAPPKEDTRGSERRHFNKAQLLEVQHIVEGAATDGEVKDVQRELKAEGLDIGKFGAQHDGVDGIAGRYTQKAIAAAMKRLDPEFPSSL